MKQRGKRALTGVLIAASGAYVWALLDFAAYASAEGWLTDVPMIAAYAVLATSWFVFPMGAALGIVMPSIVRGCSPIAAFVRGIFLGIGAGVLAAILTVLWESWPKLSEPSILVDRAALERSIRDLFFGYLATMTPVCAAWVGMWAYRWVGTLPPEELP